MANQEYPEEFLAYLKAVTDERPRAVIEHILKHGHVTTEELQAQLGYNHPPRGAADVREQGIPLVTFRVKNEQGRSIAAYRFGAPSLLRSDRLGGRKAFSKAFKKAPLGCHGARCAICTETFQPRELQIDHRVPYAVSGDEVAGIQDPDDYMLLCGSCNRAKSWSCEHCANRLEAGAESVCRECYWSSPAEYKHIALRQPRRLDVTWSAREVQEYERLRKLADAEGARVPLYVKELLRKYLADEGE